MSLLALQRGFQDAITEADGAVSSVTPMERGLAVYRNAYRARLIDCLRSSFEKTLRWIGEDSFLAAAAHHLILHPPRSWTLDDAGRGFDATLAELFPGDPEVAELARLEWAMQSAFTAPDVSPIDAASFAILTDGFGEAEWIGLQLTIHPGLTILEVRTDCGALWDAMASDEPRSSKVAKRPGAVAVWRCVWRCEFRHLDVNEATALGWMRDGMTFGALCEAMVDRLGVERGVAQAGALLGRWVGDGMVGGARSVADRAT